MFLLAERKVLRELASAVDKPLEFKAENISLECRKASQEFLTQLQTFHLWALKSKLSS